MQTTEMTVGQWRAFVRATGYKSEAETGVGHIRNGSKWEKKEGYYWDNPGFSQGDDYPVTCVSWNDVKKIISWLAEKRESNTVFRPRQSGSMRAVQGQQDLMPEILTAWGGTLLILVNERIR